MSQAPQGRAPKSHPRQENQHGHHQRSYPGRHALGPQRSSCSKQFQTLYPGKQFMDNWHIDAILHCLEQSIEGKLPRLIINMPPRHLKSIMVSVVLPAFILGLDPTARIICVSYSEELSKSLSREFRRIVESEWYRRVFDNVRLSKITENECVTEMGGGRLRPRSGAR